jgi:hypothetical protein
VEKLKRAAGALDFTITRKGQGLPFTEVQRVPGGGLSEVEVSFRHRVNLICERDVEPFEDVVSFGRDLLKD